MTREEAIRCLDVYSSTNGSGLCTDKQHYEAKQMAIKALERETCEDAELDFVQPHKKIPVNLETCEDAISRDMALEKMADYVASGYADSVEDFEEYSRIICQLPSVNPQPKTGKWIMIDKELQRYKCSECGEVIRLYKKSEIPKLEKDETLSNYPFSHCGCRMIEPRERSDKE